MFSWKNFVPRLLRPSLDWKNHECHPKGAWWKLPIIITSRPSMNWLWICLLLVIYNQWNLSFYFKLIKLHQWLMNEVHCMLLLKCFFYCLKFLVCLYLFNKIGRAKCIVIPLKIVFLVSVSFIILGFQGLTLKVCVI